MCRRGIPPSSRRKVLDLVAADLVISEQTIYVWRRQHAAEVLAAVVGPPRWALEGAGTVVPAPVEVGYGLTALIRVPQLMSGARVCPQVGSAW